MVVEPGGVQVQRVEAFLTVTETRDFAVSVTVRNASLQLVAGRLESLPAVHHDDALHEGPREGVANLADRHAGRGNELMDRQRACGRCRGEEGFHGRVVADSIDTAHRPYAIVGSDRLDEAPLTCHYDMHDNVNFALAVASDCQWGSEIGDSEATPCPAREQSPRGER